MASYRLASIALLGKFNPAIFQPEWFRAHELLPDTEIDAATSTSGRLFLTNDATIVSFESVKVEALAERWILSTQRSDWFGDLGPLAMSIFDLLSHTPVEIFGVNFIEHWPKDRMDAEAMVRKWLPLEPLARIVGEPVRLGGIVHGTWEGYRVTLTTEPSIQLKGGVFVSQNFERTMKKGVSELSSLLRADWKRIVSRSAEVVDALLGH